MSSLPTLDDVNLNFLNNLVQNSGSVEAKFCNYLPKLDLDYKFQIKLFIIIIFENEQKLPSCRRTQR